MWQLDLWSTGESPGRVAHVLPHTDSSPPGCIVENGRYVFRLSGETVDGLNASLRVNGERLGRDVRELTEVWFPWEVGFHAGFVDIELSTGPQTVHARVTVDPAQAKMTRDDYLLMLRDIISDTRSLASTTGHRTSLSRGDRTLPIAQVEFILAHTVRLIRLLEDLNASHRKRLVRTRQTVPLQSARRLGVRDFARSSRLARAMTSQDIARLPQPLRDLVLANGGRMPERILQTNVLANSARREHSEILGLVEFVTSLLRGVVRRQEALKPEIRDAVLLERCRGASNRIRRAADLPLFADVSSAPGAWQPSRLYEGVEPYRSLYRFNRDVRRGVGGIGGDFVSVPMRETYRLYETWVALRLVRAAQTLDSALLGTEMFKDAVDSSQLTFSLQATAVSFSGKALRFQATFNEVWTTQNGTGSYTRTMVPDVVFEFIGAGGANRLLILDSKYRVESQLNDAISSIHMYRDAIVRDDRLHNPVDVRRIVSGGFVIVPRMPSGALSAVSWRDQKAPAVFFRSGYQDRYALGAIVLKPGVAIGDVAVRLQRLAREFA